MKSLDLMMMRLMISSHIGERKTNDKTFFSRMEISSNLFIVETAMLINKKAHKKPKKPIEARSIRTLAKRASIL